MKILVTASVYMNLVAEVDTDAGTLRPVRDPVIAGGPHCHFVSSIDDASQETLGALSNEAITAAYEYLTQLWLRTKPSAKPTQPPPSGGMVQ